MIGVSQLRRGVERRLRRAEGRLRGLRFVPPGYWLRPPRRGGIIIDGGTGDTADFSRSMIETFGVKSIGIDPTRKHIARLEAFAASSAGAFVFVHGAIAGEGGAGTFFESVENVSGSVFSDHVNMRRDAVVSYDVPMMTIADAITLCGESRIDVLKLDIEGAEYDALMRITLETLGCIDQIVVEFHDFCIPRFALRDTEAIVDKLGRAGFAPFTDDGRVFLFYGCGRSENGR